jgi:hypothetical protein
MAITPDTKNWTWVLEKPCPECGFDASTFRATDVAARTRANAAAWPAVLERPGVRTRPSDSSWSALEYGAHVRDVFRIFAYRFSLMLEQDDPLFANWDQNVTAVEEEYGEQDPAIVGRRSDGASFTVASFATYFAHDPAHHLWDVR